MSLSLDALASSSLTNTGLTDGKAQSLQDTLQSDLSQASDEQLKKVCKDFESYFTEMVFKEMMNSVPDNSQSDSATKQAKDYYKEQLIQTWSDMSAQGGRGIGLAEQMYEQIKRNNQAKQNG